MTIYKEIQIPFSGFYESTHNMFFDDYFECECEYLRDECGASDDDIEALSDAYYSLDWHAIHLKYAQEYAAALFDALQGESGRAIAWRFKALESPRFYNFTTDRIFCEINLDGVRMMFNHVMAMARDRFTELCKERFTSRDGFSSFYDPDWQSWGLVTSDWDHNQLGVLFEAYCGLFFNDDDAMSGEGCFSAWDLMEDFRGNGGVETCISAAPNSVAYWDLLNAITEKAASHA